MQEIEIKFERENLEGIIPIGTYLADAARRMGIELWQEQLGDQEFSVVKITKGGELLSPLTHLETVKLSAERRAVGERLAEQAKIELTGELTIMTTKKPEAVKPDYEAKRELYRKEFEDLPLEKKIASLVELEAIALSDTLSYVINSPYKLVGAFVDVLAQLGFKIENEARKQARPAEHQPGEPSVKDTAETADAEPSVTEDDDIIESQPSVRGEKESDKTEQPSVRETSETTGETENPPPSV